MRKIQGLGCFQAMSFVAQGSGWVSSLIDRPLILVPSWGIEAISKWPAREKRIRVCLDREVIMMQDLGCFQLQSAQNGARKFVKRRFLFYSVLHHPLHYQSCFLASSRASPLR